MNYTHNALHGLPVRVYHVDNVGSAYCGESLHIDNLQKMGAEFNTLLARAGRAKSNREFLTGNAIALRGAMIAYRDEFKVKGATIPAPVSDDVIAAAAATSRAASKAKQQQEHERAAQQAKSRELKCAEWRSGERATLEWSYMDLHTMLRLSKDGTRIETSRGASVPVSVASMLWRIVLQTREKEPFATQWNGSPIHIGEYTLREVKADGSLIVGCHTLPYSELAGIARQLHLDSIDALLEEPQNVR